MNLDHRVSRAIYFSKCGQRWKFWHFCRREDFLDELLLFDALSKTKKSIPSLEIRLRGWHQWLGLASMAVRPFSNPTLDVAVRDSNAHISLCCTDTDHRSHFRERDYKYYTFMNLGESSTRRFRRTLKPLVIEIIIITTICNLPKLL